MNWQTFTPENVLPTWDVLKRKRVPISNQSLVYQINEIDDDLWYEMNEEDYIKLVFQQIDFLLEDLTTLNHLYIYPNYKNI